MKANMGTIDRALRFLVGAGIISLYFWGPKTPLAFIGLIPLLTAFISFCPAYKIFGISTCKKCCDTQVDAQAEGGTAAK